VVDMDTGEELLPEAPQPRGSPDDPFSEPVAERVLCLYVYQYEEIADQIKSWVRDLLAAGVSASEAEVRLRGEIEKVKPRLLAEREERMRRIEDPKMRASVVPQREIERRLLAGYMESDERVAQARQRLEDSRQQLEDSRQHLAGAKSRLGDAYGRGPLDDQAVDAIVDEAVRDAEAVADAAVRDAGALFDAPGAGAGRASVAAGDEPEKKNFSVLFGWLRKFGKH
jgi:hypothetical protein